MTKRIGIQATQTVMGEGFWRSRAADREIGMGGIDVVLAGGSRVI